LFRYPERLSYIQIAATKGKCVAFNNRIRVLRSFSGAMKRRAGRSRSGIRFYTVSDQLILSTDSIYQRREEVCESV
jgi:hypothetical protein